MKASNGWLNRLERLQQKKEPDDGYIYIWQEGDEPIPPDFTGTVIRLVWDDADADGDTKKIDWGE